MADGLGFGSEQPVGSDQVVRLLGLVRQGRTDEECVAQVDTQEARSASARRHVRTPADGAGDHGDTSVCGTGGPGAAGAGAPPPDGVGTASLDALMTEMSTLCQEELLLVLPSGARPCACPAARTVALDLLDRGVGVRMIYQHAVRGDLVTRSLVRELTQRGAEIRTSAELIDPLVAYDGETLILPYSQTLFPKIETKTATVVRNPAMVAFACAAFENLWNAATPLRPDTKDAARGIDDLKKSIVRLMAMGHKDEMVARRLGISVRTCRRHISEIMDELNATSRFQVGVHLTRAGLVDDPLSSPGHEKTGKQQGL